MRQSSGRWYWGGWLAGVLAAGVLAAAPPSSEEPPEDAITVASLAEVPATEVKNVQQRLLAFLKDLPPGHKVKIVMVNFGGGGGAPIRYAQSMTPLGADGQPDGTELGWCDWYRAPVHMVPYKNGKRQGVEKLFTMEQEPWLNAEIPWVEGRLHGVRKTYHRSGKTASEATYVNGELTGETRGFSPDGKLIRVAPYVKGKRHGEVTDYWPETGKVQQVVLYTNGQVNGVSHAWYANGQMKWERPFRNNRQHGIERCFDGQGKLEKTKYWVDGDEVDEATFKARFK